MPEKIHFNTSILGVTNIGTRFRWMNLFRVRLMHSVGAEPNQRGNSGHHQTQEDTSDDWEVELEIFSFKGNVDGQLFEPTKGWPEKPSGSDNNNYRAHGD